MTTAGNDASLSFEDAFTRLERAVQSLEAGGLSLDQALALYEEGMVLARRCTEFLDHAEITITRLSLMADTSRLES